MGCLGQLSSLNTLHNIFASHINSSLWKATDLVIFSLLGIWAQPIVKKDVFRWLFKCTGIAFSTSYLEISVKPSLIPKRIFWSDSEQSPSHNQKYTVGPNTHLSSTLSHSSQMLQMGGTTIPMQTDKSNLFQKMSLASNNRNDFKPQTQSTLPDLDNLIPFVNSRSFLEPSYILECNSTDVHLATKYKKKIHWELFSYHFSRREQECHLLETTWKNLGNKFSKAKKPTYFLNSQLKDAWIFMLVSSYV